MLLQSSTPRKITRRDERLDDRGKLLPVFEVLIGAQWLWIWANSRLNHFRADRPRPLEAHHLVVDHDGFGRSDSAVIENAAIELRAFFRAVDQVRPIEPFHGKEPAASGKRRPEIGRLL